jgi:predicted nucleotidyltransferase component of viral defense system
MSTKDNMSSVRWSLREGVEFFHLAFLAELGTRLGKDRYALKGGCNLRFFFKSIRYSEDLDIDVGNIARGTLQKAVSQTLGGNSLRYSLRAAGIEITRSSAPKQTDVTQRWKVGLAISAVDAHTKVEFSRRGFAEETSFEQADPALTTHYGLTPLLVTHYTRRAAIEQKVRALVGRTETQARDVFDLHLLMAGMAPSLLELSEEQRRQAVARALSVGFDAFKAQVLAFLRSDQQASYDSKSVWNQMVESVVHGLEHVA